MILYIMVDSQLWFECEVNLIIVKVDGGALSSVKYEDDQIGNR
jgi:hypothetical protein